VRARREERGHAIPLGPQPMLYELDFLLFGPRESR
jgi:hypothetical protein